MKNIDCRNARREIEEAALGELLSAGAKNHMLSCAACEKILRDQTKLRALVSSLGTVEAPGDFDFRLRARLAAEKHAGTGSFIPGYFFFSFRSVVVATILLLFGSALMFVSFRMRSDNSGSKGVATIVPKGGEGSPIDSKKAVNNPGPEVAANLEKHLVVVDAGVQSPTKPALKHRPGLRETVAVIPETNRAKSRDSSSTSAAVLKRDQPAEAYHTTGFPINAGYQSLKVSVDDGRGTSRTISLPTVSFGSQRALSQSASPLIASARDW